MLTDEILLKINFVQIRGRLYTIDVACKSFQAGDVVVDRADGMHGVVGAIVGDRCAVQDGGCVQLVVPLKRLVKLVLSGETPNG